MGEVLPDDWTKKLKLVLYLMPQALKAVLPFIRTVQVVHCSSRHLIDVVPWCAFGGYVRKLGSNLS